MLERAIEARSWSDALTLAIERWRDTRDPAAARLVDRVAVRCEPVGPPENHAQWIAHAATYDPYSIAMLIDYLPMRLMASEAKWDAIAERWRGTAVEAMVSRVDRFDSSSNALDRLGAMERWPDDPRLAPVLATWLSSPAQFVAPRLSADFRHLLADRLATLRDVRVLPRLRAYQQTRPADGVLAQLIEQIDQPVRTAGVDALLEQLDAPTELEALWERAAIDREARGVLADALVEVGDRRGTFITRQLAGDRAERLLRLEYERWLAFDRGTIAVRDGTEFRDGMLEVLCVGHTFTPAFAWTAVIGHRELRSVHTLRTATISNAGAFGRLVNALPALQRLEIPRLRQHMLGLRKIVDASPGRSRSTSRERSRAQLKSLRVARAQGSCKRSARRRCDRRFRFGVADCIPAGANHERARRRALERLG